VTSDATTPPSPAPPPLRARSDWEFHADERVIAASLEGPLGATSLLDAGGHAYLLDARGKCLARRDTGQRARTACRLPSGGWALALHESLLAVGERGEQAWRAPLAQVEALAAGPRGVAAATRRGSVVLLSPAGKERARVELQHPVLDLAFCSREGTIVVVGPSGEIVVWDGETVLWRLHARLAIQALASSEQGTFLVAGRELHVQRYHASGLLTGVLDPGRPVDHVAISPEGAHALLADDTGLLSYVDLSSGYVTWKEARRHRLDALALSSGGRTALVVSEAGSVELLSFTPDARGRSAHLELVGREVAAASAWRQADAVIDAGSAACRFAVSSSGQLVAVADGERGLVRLHDRQGRLVRALGEAPVPARLAFTARDEDVLVLGPEGVTLLACAGGRPRRVAADATHVVVGATGLAVACSPPPRVVLVEHDAPRWERPVPHVRLLAAHPDLTFVGIACADARFRCLDGRDGCVAWSRAEDLPDGGVLALRDGFILADARGRLTCLDLDGRVAWEVEAGQRLELFSEDGRAFGRAGDNRFYEVGDGGNLTPIDRGTNLGRSRLVGAGAELREVNVNGRVVTAFDLSGAIRWRCEAPAAIGTGDVTSSGGLLAFRAGASVCLVAIDGAPSSSGASRAVFLEI
jgi:hypothetical protein